MDISNVLSFRDISVRFEDYNVLVGNNAVGKTNMIRILKLLSGKDPKFSHNSILECGLEQKWRFEVNSESFVWIRLSFSKVELKLLLQFIFRRNISEEDVNKNYDALKNCNLIIFWSPSPEILEKPSFVCLQFELGFTLWNLQDLKSPVGTVYETYFTFIEDIRHYDKIKSIQEFLRTPRFFQGSSENNFYQENGYGWQQVFQKDDLLNFLLGVNSNPPRQLANNTIYFGDNITRLVRSKRLTENENYVSEIYQYCQWQPNIALNIWNLIHSLLRNQIVFLNEYRPSHKDLASQLREMQDSTELDWKYMEVAKSFGELFPDVEFEIKRDNTIADSNKLEYYILIKENGKPYHIESCASGYFETIALFSALACLEDSVLIMDEPALHLHPTKINYLGRVLSNLNLRQVIIVTHSPYLLNSGLFTDGKNLLYARRVYNTQQGNSKTQATTILSKPGNLKIKLKPFLFTPEIFFAKCVIFVEGASDLMSIAAIFDGLSGVHQKYDICLVNMLGKENIPAQIELVSAYDIPCVIMADSDYNGQTSNDLFKLPGKLEDELRALGWTGNSKSVKPIEVYDFIYNQMNDLDFRNKVKNCNLGKVLDVSLQKAGVSESTWN